MKLKKRRLMLEVFAWLMAELVLGYYGLDSLADYSEYLNGKDAIAAVNSSR